jgi:hypothetical protein
MTARTDRTVGGTDSETRKPLQTLKEGRIGQIGHILRAWGWGGEPRGIRLSVPCVPCSAIPRVFLRDTYRQIPTAWSNL